jgi:hypothetical protein
LFIPEARSGSRHKYCSKPECKKAGKAASQKQWLSRPENRDYFCGPDNVRRVQEWRKRNPGYWRRKRPGTQDALQETLPAQAVENNSNKRQVSKIALQDSLIMQPAVLLGLIANITGNALQDDIAATLLGMQKLGMDILNQSPQTKGGDHDSKDTNYTATSSAGSRGLQLDRSPTVPKAAS